MMKFKMKQTALLIVLLLSIGWIKADAMNENRIHCVVLNTQGNPIPFANVMVFKSLKDSIPSKILSADNQGNFKLDIDVPIGLKVSCMGYETESLIIRNVDSKSVQIKLRPSENMLNEVTVDADNVFLKDDKMVILPTSLQKRNAHDGYSMLSLMSIPGLYVDVVDKTVSTRGNETLICINGREVKSDEIATLNPQDIKRIDYYKDFSPAHPTASSVIDFIMKDRNHGGQLYLNGNQHLNLLKGNDLLDWKHYRKGQEFNVQFSDNYFHFKPKEGDNSLVGMQLNDRTVLKDDKILASPKHNNALTGKLSYLKQWKKDMFQIAGYLSKNHEWYQKNIQEFFDGVDRTSSDVKHKDYSSYALQLYYQRKTKQSIFKVKLNGSYSETDLTRKYNSLTNINAVTNEKFYHVSPSVLYGLLIGKQLAFVDVNYSYDQTKSIYNENGKLSTNKLNYDQAIITIGDNIQLVSHKLKITPQLSERIMTIDDGENPSYTKFYLVPSMFWQANLASRKTLSGNIGGGVYDPQIKYYNDSEQTLDKYQVLKGNTDIKTSSTFRSNITYNSLHKWGMIELFAQYENTSKLLFENVYYDQERDLFVHRYENGGLYERLLMNGAIQYNLIPKRLSWLGTVEYTYSIERIFPSLTNSQVMFGTIFTYICKNANAKVELYSPTSVLSMGTRIKNPMSLKIALGYNYRNWHFTINAKNPFMNNKTTIEYNRDRYYKNSHQYSPRISTNMFTLGCSYRISYGKKHNFQDVELDNKERSGVLEYDK